MSVIQSIESKIITLSQWEELRGKFRQVVFTNGCFDVLHRGHVTYLAAARDLGDCLVVGLNSDASVKRLKGENRPINNEKDRALVLAALTFIDFIILFKEDTPKILIERDFDRVYEYEKELALTEPHPSSVIVNNIGYFWAFIKLVKYAFS